jgi:fatty-acid desaturase
MDNYLTNGQRFDRNKGWLFFVHNARYQLGAVLFFLLIHIGALAVLWTPPTQSLLAWLAVTYSIRMLGVTAGYHRYFGHRSYKRGRVAQFVMAFLAQSSAQKGVLWWAALSWFGIVRDLRPFRQVPSGAEIPDVPVKAAI